ncbi:hypothetical protein Drorol1_Dr00013686 [Drosera rotundifolia]
MSITMAIINTIFYTTIFIITYYLTSHLLHKLRHLPPTPCFSVPILGHLHLLKQFPLHHTIARYTTRYGPILFLRFGSRPVLFVSSASAAEECFTKNDVIFANRPRLLAGKHLGYDYSSLAWVGYGDRLRTLRRIVAVEIFSTKRMEKMAGIRRDEVKRMMERLRGKCDGRNGEFAVVEMKGLFSDFAMNVMMRMISGKRYYGEHSEQGSDEAKRFQDIISETFQVYGMPYFGDFVPAMKLIGAGKAVEEKMIKLQEKRDAFMQDLINERRQKADEEGDKEKTLIDILLELQRTEPEQFRDEDIRSLLLVLLAAGTDTTARTIESAMSLMLKNPTTLSKAQSQIHSNLDPTRPLEESNLNNLPYLKCIIHETLRMCPAAPLLTPHESSSECFVGGYRVPRGTMLVVNVWAIQNDPEVWDQPEKFKPERFEDVDMIKFAYKLIPFGSGRRTCPGDGLAIRTVGLVLGSLLQCFDWESIREKVPGEVAVSRGPMPLRAGCRPREAMGKLKYGEPNEV